MRFQIQKDPEPQNDSTVEVLANTVSIVEQLKEKKIWYYFDESSDTSSKSSSGEISIKIGMRDGNVSPKTKLERELAKVVFDSPYDKFNKLVKNIKTNTNNDQRHYFIKNLYIIFDNLENRRVESCYGHIYRGANERFVEARPHEANGKFHDSVIPSDPITALKQARYDQDEAVKKSEFAVAIDYMRAVEMTGKMGGFELAVMYWEKVVQPFLEKNLEKPGQQSIENDLDTTNNSNANNNSEVKKNAKIQEEIESIENELPNVQDPRAKIVLNTQLRDLRAKKLGKQYKGELLLEISEPFKIWSDQKGSFEQKTSELKEKGSKEIQKIEQKLEEMASKTILARYGWNMISEQILERKPESGKRIKFSKNVTVVLKNTFKKIQGGKHPEIDSLGDDIDVESYIDYKVNHIGNFHKSTKNYTGFDIVIAIDESGSMREEMPKVRRMCATLFESISGLPNVRLTIIGWTGNKKQCIIKKITKASQIGSLEATDYTPIGKAVWYCKHLIDLQSSPKRLFVLITDGQPNELDDVDVAKEGVRIMRKRGIMCSGICVGAETRKYSMFMRDIFGDEFEICDNFTEVDEFLRKKISRQTIQLLKITKYS